MLHSHTTVFGADEGMTRLPFIFLSPPAITMACLIFITINITLSFPSSLSINKFDSIRLVVAEAWRDRGPPPFVKRISLIGICYETCYVARHYPPLSRPFRALTRFCSGFDSWSGSFSCCALSRSSPASPPQGPYFL